MKYLRQKAFAFLFLFVIVTSQNQTSIVKQDISLNEIYNIKLEKGQKKIFTVEIKGLTKDDSLFVQASSPYYDPYEIPAVIVKSENDFQKYCSEQNNQYVGICQIYQQNLAENKKFDIQVTCFENCSLKLEVFLSETFVVELGNKIQIKALKDMGTIEQFKIQIPTDVAYTDIALIAKILNYGEINEGIEMFVNVGNQKTPVPSTQDFDFMGNQVWGDGVGVFLSKQQAKPGDWVKIFMVIGEGVNIQFYSRAIDGNVYPILINTAYQDFTSQNELKMYILNLEQDIQNQNVTTDLEHKTIELVFVLYSGSPTIKVSFDEKFQTYLDNYDIQGTVSYLLTPEIRKKQGYSGIVYIQVSSYWSSNYYFSSFLVSDRFYKISDGIAQINRENQGEMQNYIYQSYVVINNNKEELQSYRLKIQIIQGSAQLGIRRCKSLQENNTLDCLLTNSSQLQLQEVKQTFEEIDIHIRKQWNAYQLLFDYNGTSCHFYRQFGNLTIYNCQFQVVIFPNINSQQLIYAVTFYQNRQQGKLKQGYSYKDYVFSESYHYYQFNLPEIENVQEVTFYLTVISGDAGIMGTTKEEFKYMEISDSLYSEEILISFFNSITFKKDMLANKFYIGVYGYEASDISVSLVVKRAEQSSSDTNKTSGNETTDGNQTISENKTVEITTLHLVQGLSQQYTLASGLDKINFGFTTGQKAQNTTIQLIQLQGDVMYHIQKQGSDAQISCNNIVQGSQLKCTFATQENSKYLVHVKANANDIQTFSVSYYNNNTCKQYPLNLPQFVFLANLQTQCSTFSISDLQKPLQILTSFSTIDMLISNVSFAVTFNSNNFTIKFNGRQKLISSDQLKQFCKSDQMDNCNMEIKYTGDKVWNVDFHFVVEQVGKEMALFDGVVRKVVDDKMTQKKGKFFYYEVSSVKDSIKIFTTNKDKVGYYIGAKFVESLMFTSSPDSLYLPFRNLTSNTLVQNKNIFETRLLPKKGTSIIQIVPEEFTKYCNACVMLISIYGLQEKSDQANIFEVQVTQKESTISFGQQKLGLLSEDQIFIYDIGANPNAQALLTIRDYAKQSQKQGDCFVASVYDPSQQKMTEIKSGYFIIPPGSSSYKIFVESKSQQLCSYQISYSSLAQPLSSITSFWPVEVKISNSETKYFLYNHSEQDSFQILNYVKSGDLKIYANKISGESTIQALLSKNLDMYDFKSVAGDSFLEIKNSGQTYAMYCKSCFYMIAVKGDPSVQSQLAISKGLQALGLTTYGILKQTLKKGQIQVYNYYSIFDYNISIPLLFGQIRVCVQNPSGKVLYNQTIKMSTQIAVPKPVTAEGQYIDYYDQNSRFVISIEAIKDSSYYISIKSKNVSMRIYQGVPVTITVEPKNNTVEFVNVDANSSVTVLVEIKNQSISEDFVLTVTAEVMKEGSVSSTKIANPTLKRSENSFNYVFESIKGTYFITISAKQKVTASLLLAKKKLTHLMSSGSNLFVDKGIYQIYTPGHNLMIVVNSCLNQVQLKASQKYDAIVNDKEDNSSKTVLLQHANYGGHYIVTAENVEGEYFVEVDPKTKNDSILYIISYFYYDREDVMPYKRVDIDPEITYELSDDKITFILKPARLIQSKQKLRIFPKYTLYISNQSKAATMDSKCGLSIGFTLSQTTVGQNQEPIRFPVDFQTISREVGQTTDIYYVSARVEVRFEGDNLISGYPPVIDLSYTKFQTTQSVNKIQIKSQTTSNLKYILLWIVVPILISSVLFILALKFCIKKYRQLYPDQLVQQDRQMGESQGQMKSSQHKATDSLTNT